MGIRNFLIKNKLRWKKINSNINNFNVISRIDDEDNKKYRVIQNYSYKINNVTYSNIHLSEWQDNDPTTKLNNSEGETILPIYYNISEPHISVTKLPIEGFNTILIGIILICFGIYIYIDKCKQKRV